MKSELAYIVISILVSLVHGQYELQFSPDEVISDGQLETPILRSVNDVTYHFFSKRHPRNSIRIRTSTVKLLNLTDFDASKDTLFIIHGWKSHNESSVNNEIRESILDENDLNVFVVDWSPMAGKNYFSAKNAVVRVGQYVAEFVTKLEEGYNLDVSKVKFVGHSLGAHIAGNAGAALGGKVDRILGLDPAGPFFTVKNTDNRLDPTDARFVSIIHTNGGKLGFGVSMGHVDYWPNGGKSQPGCKTDLLGSCAHSRAYAYYAESLRSSRKFTAVQCSSYSSFVNGECLDGNFSFMGKFKSDYSAKGDYYLFTHEESPYAIG